MTEHLRIPLSTIKGDNDAIEIFETDMGIQSNDRRKSTTCKKDRPKHIIKYNKKQQELKQTGLVPGENTIFNRLVDCSVCVAYERKKYNPYVRCKVPHQSHHPLCPLNTKTKGRVPPSTTEATTNMMSKYLSKKAVAAVVAKDQNHEKTNVENTPSNPSSKPPPKQAPWMPTLQQAPSMPPPKTAVPVPKVASIFNFQDIQTKKTTVLSSSSGTKLSATSLRSLVNAKMTQHCTSTSPGTSIISTGTDNETCDVSAINGTNTTIKDPINVSKNTMSGTYPPLIVIAKYLRDIIVPPRLPADSNNIPNTDTCQKSITNYKKVFPAGQITFKLPNECCTIKPSPYYHAIQGINLLLVQWELNFPGILLSCDCSGEFIHERSDLSKKNELFPIFDLGGTIMWAIVMNYKCNKCSKIVAGNSAEMLNTLPVFLRDSYPVHPKYAHGGSFHFSKKLSQLLEHLIVKYGNAEMFSRMLYHELNEEYRNRIDKYYDQCIFLKAKENILQYPTFLDWMGGHFPPDGSKIRELYEKAQQSTLTRSGISEFDRCTREIQSVTCNLTMAQDHTMEVVKNYQRKKIGAFAAWTVCTETGEAASVVLVKDTTAKQYAHAAECLARRQHFKPKVMYADTWPNKSDFWALLFGNMCIGRLGMFHFLNRIIKTLREHHMSYSQSIRDLRMAIYKYNDDDYLRLEYHLKNGTMSRTRTKYTAADIDMMMVDGTFKDRYEKWLRKEIYDPETMKARLDNWFIKYKFSNSQGKEPGHGKRDSKTGKLLFTSDTKLAVENAKEKCNYVSDYLPIDQMYTAMPPTPHSTHGLNAFLSHRVESRLEGFHGPLSNFANTNTNARLADILTLTGVAQYNCHIRQKYLSIAMSNDEKKKIPAHLLEIPRYYNHSELEVVNRNAEIVGLPPPFLDIRILPEDNGERFLSQYLFEQQKRDQTITPHINTDRCQCCCCGNNMEPLLHEKVFGTINHQQHEENISLLPLTTSSTKNIQMQPKKKAKTIVKTKQNDATLESNTHLLPPCTAMMTAPSIISSSQIVPSMSSNMYGCSNYLPVTTIMYPQRNPPQNAFFIPWQSWTPHHNIPYYQPHPLTSAVVVPEKKRKRKLQKDICCLPYAIWLNNQDRKGRPPHDISCPKKNKK